MMRVVHTQCSGIQTCMCEDIEPIYMNPQSACALLHTLARTKLEMSHAKLTPRDTSLELLEIRTITSLLTGLLGRVPEDHEIQAARAF